MFGDVGHECGRLGKGKGEGEGGKEGPHDLKKGKVVIGVSKVVAGWKMKDHTKHHLWLLSHCGCRHGHCCRWSEMRWKKKKRQLSVLGKMEGGIVKVTTKSLKTRDCPLDKCRLMVGTKMTLMYIYGHGAVRWSNLIGLHGICIIL